MDLGGTKLGATWFFQRSCDQFKTRVFSFSVSSFASTPSKDLHANQNQVPSPECVMYSRSLFLLLRTGISSSTI